MVKCDLKMMFVDVLEWNQSYSDKKRRYQMWAAAFLNFFQRGYPMILAQNFKCLQSVHIVKLDKEILFVNVLEWNQSHSDKLWIKFEQPPSWIFF